MEKRLKGLSSQGLRILAVKANKLAEELEGNQPTYDLALLNGVKDESYSTAANGRIASYSGEAIIAVNGLKWKAIGRRPTGNAFYAKDGYIEFIPVE